MRHLPYFPRVAVELAEQRIAIFFGPIGQLSDKVFNLFAGGISQSFCAAEFDGICLYQIGIELMLADDLAETISYLRTASL